VLRISSIRHVDGTLIAGELCVVSGGRAWIPKGAYDERFARYSPGRILLLAEIEAAFNSPLEAVELLGDADQYKLAFATVQRRLCTAHSFGWRAVPLARIGYRRRIRPRLRLIYKSIRT
jgi:CelD/BcsL family acetyltransferase involved in cellulose biosynthesis